MVPKDKRRLNVCAPSLLESKILINISFVIVARFMNKIIVLRRFQIKQTDIEQTIALLVEMT